MMEFEVYVKDRIGAVRDVAKAIGEAGVNIKAISSEVRGDQGLLHVVSEDASATRDALKKGGYKFDEVDVVKVEMEDKPGELARFTGHLADAGVYVKAAYILGKVGEKTEVAFTVDNLEKAKQVNYGD